MVGSKAVGWKAGEALSFEDEDEEDEEAEELPGEDDLWPVIAPQMDMAPD